MPTLLILGNGNVQRDITPEVFETLALAVAHATAEILTLKNGAEDVGVIGLVEFTLGLNTSDIIIIGFASHTEQIASMQAEWKAAVLKAIEEASTLSWCSDFFSRKRTIEFHPMTPPGAWGGITIGGS